MTLTPPSLVAEVTRDPGAIASAQALRGAVFHGAEGPEADDLDPVCDHVVLRDPARDGAIVGTLRIASGAAYTGREFDVGPLLATGRPLAEIGRTCLAADHRGGMAAAILFNAAFHHLRRNGVELLCGAASLPGADPARHGTALRALRARALAPEGLRPVARGAGAIATTGEADPGAIRSVPSLIKAYLHAGAWVGEGAWVDHVFDTIDVCVVMDLARMRLPAATRRLEALR